MSKKLLYFIITLLGIGIVTSCNTNSDDDNPNNYSYSTVVVSSFSLSKNDKLLKGLDSVFFSIDLKNAQVYNADSLPYGTDITKLVAVIGVQGCSVADLYVPRKNQPDTVINYLKNAGDSIDFSNGPLKLHLESASKDAERDYYISVNVHKMKPDSLYWNKTARRNLPSAFNVPLAQKTVKYQDNAICLTYRDGKYSIATSNNIEEDQWTINEVTFPFTPKIESLTATTSELYMTDDTGKLYSSIDGISWKSCPVTVHHIYGAYGATLLFVQKDNDGYSFATFPQNSIATPIPVDCPIAGTSPLISISNEWSNREQVFMIGGVKADGQLTGSMWGYDGKSWAKISHVDAPAASGRTFFPYVTFKTNETTWETKSYLTLFAFGGKNAKGENDKTVYISVNMGLNWKKADDLIQLPDYMPAMSNAQALIFDSKLSVNSFKSSWKEMASRSLPAWYDIEDSTKPITSWDCPYIYIFGGTNNYGQLYNTVWRGVINRLSFKPLQ